MQIFGKLLAKKPTKFTTEKFSNNTRLDWLRRVKNSLLGLKLGQLHLTHYVHIFHGWRSASTSFF
jgi:hypothetical protein